MLKMWCSILWLITWGEQSLACRSTPTRIDAQEELLPIVVWYNDRHRVLDVLIKLLNVPPKVNRYDIYRTKEYEPYGSSSFHDGHLVRSEPDEKRPVHIQFNVTLEKSISHTIFEVSLKSNENLCNRALNRKFLKIIHTQKKQTEKACLKKQCEIAMDWKNECFNTPVVETAPTVTPTKLENSSYPFAVFTCTARCKPGEVLVWYQDKGLPEPTVLVINQTHHHLTDTKIDMQVLLNKTLEESDRNSTVYCAQRVITKNEDGELVLANYGENNNGITSKGIVLDFDKSIKTDVPKVTVKPRDEVSFEPNTTMEFECSSKLVDGRGLEWYEGDSNFVRRRRLEPTLIQSDTTTTSTLKLQLDESYDMKSVYCVQEHRIVYKARNVDVNFTYGEIARSEVIKLRRQTNAGWTSDRTHKLIIAGACVVGALVILLAGLIVSRRRRHETADEETEYVTPQVTYAVLALPQTDSKPPKKPDKLDYVEIVGVYKDKSKNK